MSQHDPTILRSRTFWKRVLVSLLRQVGLYVVALSLLSIPPPPPTPVLDSAPDNRSMDRKPPPRNGPDDRANLCDI